MKNAVLYHCADYGFECSEYEKYLPPERLERYRRLKPLKEKQNCLGAYLLLRYALKANGINEFELARTENGKPYIVGSPLFFNLSHTACGFVCAVDSHEIGADIEKLHSADNSLLRRVCSSEEIEMITASLDPCRTFTTVWTLKESAIKMNAGTLMQYSKYSFKNISDDFYSDSNHFVSFHNESSVISVCGKFEAAEYRQVQFNELL